ncbi:hypothetical protein RHS04_06113 [Rhizoctonia solani]|uniref:Uncharacterized protein n=1 Tax=Rhizoctonia solani TaxID=456999 RepID=A0A8H7H6D8_9AGAM|nr:hypothetical protein RHS04_06113 [Rhizoctonia solani]
MKSRNTDLAMPVPSQSWPAPAPAQTEARGLQPEASNSITPKSEDQWDPANGNTNYIARPSILGAGLLYMIGRPVHVANKSDTTLSEEFDRSWPQEQLMDAKSREDPAIDIMKAVEAFCQSVPPSVDARKATREAHFSRKLHEYCLLRVSYWFMPPPLTALGSLANQFGGSKRIIWIMYLTASIFQSFEQVSQACVPASTKYIAWIDTFEQKFTTDSRHNLSLSDMSERLMAHLELAFLKFAVADSVSGYALLKRALPKFLKISSMDSNSLMEDANGWLVISFSYALTGPRNELRRFATYDTIVAFLFGVPPLAEYGYNHEYGPEPQGFEWSYGIPTALLQVVSQVNSWRYCSRVALDDWQTLEKQVLGWESSYALLDEASGADPASVARNAVQEGWRHGICGASSYDPRVQASVHRVFELSESANSLQMDVHLVTHCVVVGVAARLEKHRVAAYEKLRSFKYARACLFDGTDFSRALYHLWHGVGLGGAPVTWEDYVQSRRAVIPM